MELFNHLHIPRMSGIQLNGKDATLEELECDTSAIYKEVEARFRGILRSQIDQEQLDEAHCTWNMMVEACVLICQGQDLQTTYNEVQRRWCRDAPPRIQQTAKNQTC